jgi:hypothetical protein
MNDARTSGLPSWAVAVVCMLIATAIAVPAGVIAIFAVDPGYTPRPVAALLLLVPAAAIYGLVRTAARRLGVALGWLLVVPLGAAAASTIFLVATAPAGPDRDRSERLERAMLEQIAPYPGARSTSVSADAQSSSDWGISFLNPPESYLTSRIDQLPPGRRPHRVADVYERELRAHGFRVYRFAVHYPVEGSVHLGGHRGAEFLEVTISPTQVVLSASA